MQASTTPRNPFVNKKMPNYRNNHKNQLDLFRYSPTYYPEVEEFVNYWNARIWMPPITKTDRQLKNIRDAFRREYFKNNWRLAIANVAKSHWLRCKMRRKFSLDFFLIPDNFDKICEGFYIDTEEKEDILKPNYDKNGEEIL